MKRIIPIVALFALLVIVASCSKKSSSPSNGASVLFFNGCINGTSPAFNLGAKVNNTTVPGATNLALLQNSGYQNVTAGTGDSVIFLTSGLYPFIGGMSTLTAGSSYSVFAGGLGTSPSFLLTSDDLSTPASGNFKVRLVNLSPDMLNESFYIGSSTLDSNISYNTASPFIQLAATSGNVLVQDPSKPTKLPSSIGSQTFVAGKIYTIILTGAYAGTGSSALSLTILTNN